MGAGDKNPSVEDIIAAKLKAKAEEAAREAAEDARGGGSYNVSIGNNARSFQVGGDVSGRDKVTTSTTVHGNQTVVHGDQVGGDKVGGDKFGGDKITGDKITAGHDVVSGTQTNTTGLTADDVAKLYDSIYQKIAAKPQEDQPDLKEAVDTIKQAAEKEAAGEKPDAATEKEVKSASQAIAATSPDLLDDVLDVATATLANPAAGVAMIIRKVLEKAKALRGGATA